MNADVPPKNQHYGKFKKTLGVLVFTLLHLE